MLCVVSTILVNSSYRGLSSNIGHRSAWPRGGAGCRLSPRRTGGTAAGPRTAPRPPPAQRRGHPAPTTAGDQPHLAQAAQPHHGAARGPAPAARPQPPVPGHALARPVELQLRGGTTQPSPSFRVAAGRQYRCERCHLEPPPGEHVGDIVVVGVPHPDHGAAPQLSPAQQQQQGGHGRHASSSSAGPRQQ